MLETVNTGVTEERVTEIVGPLLLFYHLYGVSIVADTCLLVH